MTPRRIAGLCCLLGGAVWVARWVLAPSGSAADAMRYAGLALLGVGLLIAGAGLARRGTWWLRAVAGVGAAGLTWSVVEMFRPVGGALMFDSITGIVAIIGGIFASVTGRARTPRRSAGAHAR
ncbi:hypothetical protein [Nocardioides sp. InS609-2]|uniref:hypothetical protein n=1 Tax=Nocardioides sp. InS609-2 TaxID=2760705 RepID=UPI0017E31880|nr:hypothetical protein [Nocardioides sp. InS609-2]MBA3783293.1 hypothetical protein [Nocardioides sp.]